MALRPFASRGILAYEQHAQSQDDDDYEWDNVGNAPSFMWCETLRVNKRVVDSRHDETARTDVRETHGRRSTRAGGVLLCDSTSRITPACGQGVGGSHNVLIEETGAPYLARDKCATKDANEETQSD